MAWLLDRVTQLRTTLEQKRELDALRAEAEQLRQENEKVRTAMRRCVTCHYRLEFVESRKAGDDENYLQSPPPSTS